MNWFFLNQVNPSFDPSQILILGFPKPRAFLPPLTVCVRFYPRQLEPLFNTIISMFFIGFSILSYPIQPHAHHHKYWINQTIWQTQPIKFLIKLYADHNTLCVKQAIHEKVESLRAASLSKLDSTVNKNYLQYKACRILYKMIGSPSFSQPYLCIQQLLQSSKICSSTYFSQLSPPYSTLTKSYLQFPLTLHFSIPQQFFTSLFLRTTILAIYTKNIFPTSTIQPIQAASGDQEAMQPREK